MKLSAILSTDYDQFESLVGQRKKRKFVNSIVNFSNIRLSLWRRCCLTKEEISKEAQTFIKAVGDFLATAVAVGFLPTWFCKVYETQKFKKIFDSFDSMYDYADITYPLEAENVDPFMRGVTISDRPVRVQFVDRQ
ncbi:hypothetical protein pdam_00025313 [Pocillopora damicornis]|uniref:Uncharacterized protein n=1 Tax=Pocillopora damicornis TaxID=46731 RepID=A0A3M6TKT3_POCDA|nr:hypothetical protein pdam_00025313 [Pocillopora damicornis]